MCQQGAKYFHFSLYQIHRPHRTMLFSLSLLFLVQLFVIQLFIVQNAFANDSIEISSSNDFEAPKIEHDLRKDVTRDKQGNIIVKAIVTDEFSINSVSLFFRNPENKKYRKRVMLPDAESGNDIYKARIPKSALSGERIEYYFEADDKVGNKKLKGLEFSPLKRLISDLEIINGNSVEIKKIASNVNKKPVKEKSNVTVGDLNVPMIWIPGI